MTTTLIDLDDAITLLKKAVKFSHIAGQKHIDLSLVNAIDLGHYQNAMISTRAAVMRGDLTEDELKDRLGLV